MPTKLHFSMSFSKIHTKIRKKILKEARRKNKTKQKHITYRGTKIRIISNISSDTNQVRSDWREIFKVLREKKNKKI